MASKVLCISEAGWKKVSLFRDSIKLLFDVDIILLQDKHSKDSQDKERPTGDTRNDPVEALDYECLEDSIFHGNYNIPMRGILMETDGSPTNIENAQKYAVACFPSHPRYKVITVQLHNLQTFETVHRHSTSVQLSTASALTFNLDHLKLTIQGHESCVEQAEREVNMIIEDYLPKDTLNQLTQAPFSPALDESYQNYKPQSVIETDGESVDNFQLSRGHTFLNDLSASADSSSLHVKSSTSSSSAVESDDDNNVINNALTDSHQNQVKQAIKLGYDLNQIQAALEKLGPDCSTDDLLSELIKIGNEQSENILSSDELVDNELTFSMKDLSLAVSDDVKHSPRRVSLEFVSPLDLDAKENLRSIVIDGSNVAMSHGQDKFSCQGIKIAVDWFRKRGHTDITVFVPQWRKETSRPDAPIENQHILLELERERILTFTPSRRIQGRRIVSYDDRYILKHADDVDGIVVSKDEYRDLVRENEAYRKVVEQRLLPYTFVKDKFMPPDDPLGRLGPSLDDFLRKVPAEPAPRPQDCPFGKKCTFGNKCRYYHPERGFASQKSITETLKEQANITFQEIASKKASLSANKGRQQKQKLARTKSLVPGETLPQTYLSDAPQSDGAPRFKQKLNHSKSLVSPTKTGDYLTASRLKLEEAESKESSRSFSPLEKDLNIHLHGDCASTTQKVQKHRKGSADVVQSCSPSPRTSPAPSSDFTIESAPSNSTFTGPTPDSGATPFSRLNVPNSQSPQESFSGGHLSVAKRLSDERNEKSFFGGRSDITDFDEKKNANKTSTVDNCSPPDYLDPDKIYDAEEHLPKITDDQLHTCDNSSSLTHLQSLDSGNFSMHGSPQPPMTPQNFPVFPSVAKKESSSHGHQNLHRSLSSSYSMKGPDNVYRRTSDAIGLKGNEHPQLRGQQSSPIHRPYFHRNMQASVPGILVRQNSSSNPEIYPWAESFDSGNCLDSGFGSYYYSAPLLGAGDVNHSIHDPAQAVPPSFPMSVHQTSVHYPSDQYLGSTHAQRVSVAKPSTAMPGDRGYTMSSYPPVGPPVRGHDCGFQYQHGPNLQGSVMSQQHPYLFPYSVHSPHSSTMYSPRSSFQGHPTFPSQQSLRHYENQPNQNQLSRPKASQTVYQQDYHQSYHPTPANNSVTPVDQDAPINPGDIRYPIYYNLSSVYGEKVVRNFMNRNPDVKDFDQLIKLIGTYIVDAGVDGV